MVEVPTVIGWLRPVVLMPASALSGMGPQQLEAILAHELAHIRRHDYLVNLLQTLVETLLFYHPAVWWLSGRIRVERENCCDDLAVSLCGDPYTYAKALADLEELRADSSRLVLAATGRLAASIASAGLIGAPSHAGRGPGWLAGSTAVVLIAGIAAGAVGTNALGSEQVDASPAVVPALPMTETSTPVLAAPSTGVVSTRPAVAASALACRERGTGRRERASGCECSPARRSRPPSRRRRWAKPSHRLSRTCSNSSHGGRRRCRRHRRLRQRHRRSPAAPPNSRAVWFVGSAAAATAAGADASPYHRYRQRPPVPPAMSFAGVPPPPPPPADAVRTRDTAHSAGPTRAAGATSVCRHRAEPRQLHVVGRQAEARGEVRRHGRVHRRRQRREDPVAWRLLRIREGGWIAAARSSSRPTPRERSAAATGKACRRSPSIPDGKAWLAQALPRIIRQTAFGATGRVARILKPSTTHSKIFLKPRA